MAFFFFFFLCLCSPLLTIQHMLLKGANLEGALFITQEQLDEANGNYIEIKFPDATGPFKRSHTIRPR